MDMDQMIDAQHELHLRILRSVENLKKIGAAKLNIQTVRAATRILDEKWTKFLEQHEELRCAFWKELKTNDYMAEDLIGQAETAYYEQRSELAGLEEKLTKPSGAELAERVREAAPSRKALPRINLPTFSGKFEDWPGYRDLFRSMVLGDPSLSKIEQLHYLKTSVKGDAELLIRNLPSVEENLGQAWDLLTTYFENKRFLVRSYLSAFTALPRLKTPSTDALRRLFHGVLSTVGALKGIGRPISNCTDLFVHLVVELLDPETRREWESSLGKSSEPPSYDQLQEFLQEQLMTSEALHTGRTGSSGGSSSKSSEKSSRTARTCHVKMKGADPSRSCPLCKGDHFIAYCEQYKKKTGIEKREIVAAHQRCWNCLGRHLLADCKSTKTCAICSGRHHSTLHDAFTPAASPAAQTSSAVTVLAARRQPLECAPALLATARVLVADRSGARHTVRALIDPGSEVSLIAESLAQRLRLPRTPASTAIFGVGGVRSGASRGRVAVNVFSRDGHYALAVSTLVLPSLRIYGGSREGGARSWPHLDDLTLADPEFHHQDPVELLLGADVYLDFAMPEGLRRGAPHEPGAQLTRFGWVLLGPTGACHLANPVSSLQCSTMDELADLVRRFWQTEEPPRIALPLTADEQECEEHFVHTHERLPDGRYQVRLPLRQGLPDLSSTRRAASHLLDVMRRRFEHDHGFGTLYQAFMREYIALGHMSPTTPTPSSRGDRISFLPHHGVLRGSGAGSKIRVVFNGSTRTGTGASLNDFLYTGPNLLPSLTDTLTRWRRHRYVFVADVQMMYRQILLHPDDRDLQRILWAEDNQISEYQLNTVTYGLASAPYLAIRVLRQLAIDEANRFPLGADVLRHDVYVDDVLTGASSLDTTCSLMDEVVSLCMAGGFPLRKWAANDARLLERIPLEHRLSVPTGAGLPFDEHSVLGLRWNSEEDTLSLTVRPTTTAPPTKRSVLSQTARLFDPLGWLAPILVRAKLLIQTAWLQQLDWDAPLAREDAAVWTNIEEELPVLEEIRLPRWLRGDTPDSCVELHGFSDASERAYAAVVYIRTEINGQASVHLVGAKSKVAPLKRVSLPRLELCGAALLSKLAEHVRLSLGLERSAVQLWTDSTVTLGWIRGHPAKWTTYVANRVAEVHRDNQEASWRHIPGKENPADCASRGLSPKELLHHPLWWRGPAFLSDHPDTWPMNVRHSDTADLPEQRSPRCLVITEAREPEELCRFSSLRRLLRVSSWIWRWRTRRLNSAGDKIAATFLGPEELEAALIRWIRVAQTLSFQSELRTIHAKKSLPASSSLRNLSPVLDNEGILRVGGRLKHSTLDADQQHPIILPSKSHITYLVIDAAHRRTLHGGIQATLSNIRQRFWVPRARQLVRCHIHRCLPCVRWRAATPQPMMGNLPRARVRPSPPFQHTGVDLAGPVWLRTTKGRGHKAHKGFLVVFVCFSSRAVHLEVASDYSAEAFLAAFRRFVSRRGLCAVIYSDCGTNFVGADRQLRDLFKAASREVHTIVGHLADEGVRWSFNPPSAPHFGGLWEAAVKAVKHHLRRTIGEARLTFEELSTLLAEVEACLNSRPLMALSDDPDDLGALTPGHFLVGGPLLAIPEPSLLTARSNCLSRWRLLQQMRDHLWRRWTREYIQGLNPRPKWWATRGALLEGQLCLVKGENTPPCRWPLARVTRLHPGEDGQVRVVDLRTSVGELTRPVVKLIPLPTIANDPGPPA